VLLTTSLTTASVAFDSDMTDILIRLGQAPWPADIVAHRLFDSDLIPICSPALLRADPPLRRAEDLKKHTLLYSELRPDGWQRWLKMTGLPPLESFNTLKLESSSLVYEAAAEGLGVALGERMLIGDDLRKRRLLTPLEISQKQPEGFYMIHQQQSHAAARLREFRDWILKHGTTPPAGFPVSNPQAKAS
jgi:LysR family glycine cleavage system transcriptional activator